MGNKSAESRLIGLGYPLDDIPAPGAIYKPVTVSGQIAYVSGAVPMTRGVLTYAGKVPTEISVEDAAKAAALCAANNLRMALHHLGSLEAVKRVLRLTGYVNASPTFEDVHIVINGASELLRHVFGDAGVGARSALGMNQLPLGSSVETELILELNS